jgi:hypothetical protein
MRDKVCGLAGFGMRDGSVAKIWGCANLDRKGSGDPREA